MLVAIGLDVDPTLAHFVRCALDEDVPCEAVNLRAAIDGEWEIDMRGDACFRFAGREVTVRGDDCCFARIIDLGARDDDARRAARWRSLILAVTGWLGGASGAVANRPHRDSHNGSKPLHESTLRRLGLRVPESITTSSRDDALAFVGDTKVISKTVCGLRATAALVGAEDLADFEPEAGPIHLQRRVEGDDARVHVIGGRVVAQRVSDGGVDYRKQGSFDDLETFDPPPEMTALLVEATAALGLAIAGWDFKIPADGTWWCLEANPMPGFSPYDQRAGGQISRFLREHLMESACGTTDRT